ncbi:MAG: biotin/lipoyl-containing protein [Alphaproteobacteria bacterium]|jgi:acetyl-CoA carboxylase biotin carboxyl carrier protein
MAEEFDIDAELIRKLADLLEETGLGEIEYEAGGARVRVARPGAAISAPAVTVPPAGLSTVPAAPAAAPEEHPGAVTAPMVGTVYLSAAPGEPPLVRVGDTVAAGQPLLLIEAMKTFNEVRAPRAGKVTAIIVESGQPVEYGETLAIVE